jgi:hypothetical protein
MTSFDRGVVVDRETSKDSGVLTDGVTVTIVRLSAIRSDTLSTETTSPEGLRRTQGRNPPLSDIAARADLAPASAPHDP